MSFRYILTGNGNKAVAIHSDMNMMEFKDYIRENSKKTHPEGNDKIFSIGMMQFMNPKVYTPNDFANFCPYLI